MRRVNGSLDECFHSSLLFGGRWSQSCGDLMRKSDFSSSLLFAQTFWKLDARAKSDSDSILLAYSFRKLFVKTTKSIGSQTGLFSPKRFFRKSLARALRLSKKSGPPDFLPGQIFFVRKTSFCVPGNPHDFDRWNSECFLPIVIERLLRQQRKGTPKRRSKKFKNRGSSLS
jgi:hypothetical protein